MERDATSESRRGRGSWLIVGLVVFLVIGAILVGIGFVVGRLVGGQSSPIPTPPQSVLPSSPVVYPTYTPLAPPAATSLPTATPLPATEPPAATATSAPAAQAMVVAQENGVNVRSGPGTGFAVVGRLEPGAQARVTGRYSDWWQIDLDGTAGWVANWVVTSSNTEGVPEVVPPASPVPSQATAAPPAPTRPPASAGLPLGDSRGLEVTYSVSGAPGPYAAGSDIPFNFTAINQSSETLVYDALGTWVQDTDIFQKSYSRLSPALDPPVFVPGWGIHNHTDHVKIPTPGTYNLYLVIHLLDDGNVNPVLLAGPVQVVVQ